MAGRLPPAGWLQRDSPLEPLLEPDSGLRLLDKSPSAELEMETQTNRVGRGLSELAFQGLVYGLVLAPPLRLAIGNPASFFGMLNVRSCPLGQHAAFLSRAEFHCWVLQWVSPQYNPLWRPLDCLCTTQCSMSPLAFLVRCRLLAGRFTAVT